MKKTMIFFCLVIISFSAANAQFQEFTNQNLFFNSFAENLKSDASSFYNVNINLIQSPFQFDNDDLMLTGAILGLTTIAMPLDDRLRNDIRKTKSKTMDRVTSIPEKFGNPKYSGLISISMYLTGLLTNESWVRETGLMMTEAILFNGLITTAAKKSFGRSRPFTNEGIYGIDFFEFENEFEDTSLPSGHTSTAFTMATVLSERIDNIYASVALYSLASMTAYQRMYADKHWFSDTILGAALGTVIGLKVVKLHEQHFQPKSGFSYSLYPQVNSSQYGVGLAMMF